MNPSLKWPLKILSRALPLALLLVLLASLPGKAGAPVRSTAQNDEGLSVFVLAPLVEIYEGDTISLPYIVDKPQDGKLLLAPLTPGTATVSAQIGSASITPDGLGGTIVYKAQKQGEESLSITVSNYFGSASGSFDFTVKPRPNYSLDFFIVSEGQDEAGGGFRAIFSGEGQFANVPDAPIEGKGSADTWFALWVTNDVFVCNMNPIVQGTSAFTITGYPGLSPLLPPPGFLEPFTLDLQFEPVSLNASTLSCQGMGEMSLTYPWPASQGNPNEYPMKGLEFPGEGGVIEITANKSHGYIATTRMEP